MICDCTSAIRTSEIILSQPVSFGTQPTIADCYRDSLPFPEFSPEARKQAGLIARIILYFINIIRIIRIIRIIQSIIRFILYNIYTNNRLRRGSGELFLKKLANFVETRTEKLLLNCAPAIGLMHVHPQVLPISLASLSGKLRHCCLLPAHRNARRRKI